MESNVNLQSLDPRKQELLEARFLGSRFQPLNASSNPQDNSNLSAGSNAGDDEAHLVLTPEKPKTPSERKRKRKATASDSTESTTPKSTRPEANGKKINDYFKQNQSPSRSSMNTHLGTKSPSPQGIPYGYTVPSPGSLSNSDSMGYPPQRSLYQYNKAVQTDVEYVNTGEHKDNRIEDLLRQNEELRRQVNTQQSQLTAQQKLIEKHKETSQKCLQVNKSLLIEKSKLEKKTTRQKSMGNRLRLGQFVTQRQGATFVENWVDGWAFTDLMKQQERIAQEREDIEKQRKLLVKKKPNSTVTKNPKNDNFLKPGGEKPLTLAEFYEQDEILKLRQASLKKEDADIQLELEKLERERNLHIRELKRIHNEDNSR